MQFCVDPGIYVQNECYDNQACPTDSHITIIPHPVVSEHRWFSLPPTSPRATSNPPIWIQPRGVFPYKTFESWHICDWVCMQHVTSGCSISRSHGCAHGPLARYVKITVCACAGNVFPPPRVSNPDMHHGACVTHVPWCTPGSLTTGVLWIRWRGKRFRHNRRMRRPQFYLSGKRPMERILQCDAVTTRLLSPRSLQEIHHRWCMICPSLQCSMWHHILYGTRPLLDIDIAFIL